MNNALKENKRMLIIILVLLFVLLFVVYFAFVSPVVKQLKGAENNVSTLETEISALQLNLDKQTSTPDVDSIILEKKVPLAPELENLLLTFQEIEFVSGSVIENIQFRYDGELPESWMDEEDTESDDSVQDEGESTDESDEEQSPPAVSVDVNKPENLRVITAVIDVQSPNYERFQDFLTEIEKRERITRVDKLEFEKPAEKALLEGEPETMTMTMEVTTFYYED